MSNMTDEQHVEAVKRAADALYEACRAAADDGLQVQCEGGYDDGGEKYARVDVYLSRNYKA